jgi:hypothetical protein
MAKVPTPTDTIPLDQWAQRKNLDLAWQKIENGRQQETEGRKLWVEGTLELSNILDYARKRLDFDQAFGTWLTGNGYGEDRLTRHDRQALLNMALHPDLTREVLEQTHRRSWQLIWREEMQPRLPSNRQPADEGEKPPANTRRAKKEKGAKEAANGKQKPEWVRDIGGWFNNQVACVNGVINELNKIMESCTPEQHGSLQTLELTLLSEAFQNGVKESAKFVDFVDTPLEEAADKLIREGSRVRKTPAPKPARSAARSVQPGA